MGRSWLFNKNNTRDDPRAVKWADKQRADRKRRVLPPHFGWYSSPEAETPEHDPGFDVPCPYCGTRVGRHAERPIVTVSLTGGVRPDRSYFYRAHKSCKQAASDERVCEVESVVIDGLI